MTHLHFSNITEWIKDHISAGSGPMDVLQRISIYEGSKDLLTYISSVVPSIGERLQLNTQELSGNYEVVSVTHFIRDRWLKIGRDQEDVRTFYHPNSTVIVRKLYDNEKPAYRLDDDNE